MRLRLFFTAISRPSPTLVSALAIALVTAGSGAAEAAKVSVFKIVSIQLINDAVAGFEASIKAKMPDVEFKEYDAQGQPNLFPTIARQIVRNDNPDLIAVIGTPVILATAEAAKQAGSNVPIVFIAMGDPVGAGIAESLEKPGKNATGTTDWIAPEQTLTTVLAAIPGAKKIGNIWDPSNQNGRIFHDALAKAIDARKLELVDVSIGSPGEVFNAAQSLGGRADIILIGPDSAIVQGLPAVGGVALKNKIPLVIMAGEVSTPGVLMNLGVDYGKLGSAAGEKAVQALRGATAGTIPISGPENVVTSVNKDTVAAIGLSLPATLEGAAR